MRTLQLATVLIAMLLAPAAVRAGLVLDASVGKGYQTSSPKGWGQSNLMLAPGFAPSTPVLSMFQLQLGIVVDFSDKSGSKTDMELRPMLTVAPPVVPLYGRLILVFNNLLGRTDQRELAYGAALGARVGIPSIAIIPGFGVFAEVAALPRSHDYGTESNGGTVSKTFWVVEGRVGAYLKF
jgi:hypothetical protein